MSKRQNSLLKNAMIIAIGGLLVKLLGALYRIPLNNVLKAEGLGIYQTAFPTYLILMTFCGASASSAITKIIASGENGKTVLKKSLALLLPVGIFGWFIMTFFSESLSALQGNVQAKYSYVALAPSLIFVSVISCFRGYFQGKCDMKPTAASQLTEQVVKISVGLFLCFLFGSSPERGACLACFAVSVSELAATIHLIALYKSTEKSCVDFCRSNDKYLVNRLIAQLFPIALTSTVLPLAKLFDSFVVVNVLNDYLKNATELYGLYSGSVESVIGMPVALCYGIAASVLPKVSAAEAKRENEESKRYVVQALAYTLFVSAIAFAFLVFFPKFTVRILFPKISAENKIVLRSLIVFSAINVVLLSVIQTSTSVLVAKGRPFAPALSLFCGLAAKIAVEIPLIKEPKINIFGTLYSDILYYFVAVISNIVYIIVINAKGKNANEVVSCGRGRATRRLVAQNAGTGEKNG